MNINNTKYMCKILYYVLHETTISRVYQHQLKRETTPRENQISYTIPNLQISTPIDT